METIKNEYLNLIKGDIETFNNEKEKFYDALRNNYFSFGFVPQEIKDSEFYLEIIKMNINLTDLIPEKYKINMNIVMYIASLGLECVEKYILDDKSLLTAYPIAVKNTKKDDIDINKIPLQYYSDKLALELAKKGIKDIPKEFINKDVAEAIVENNELSLDVIPEKYIDEDLAFLACTKFKGNTKYVPRKIRKNVDDDYKDFLERKSRYDDED